MAGRGGSASLLAIFVAVLSSATVARALSTHCVDVEGLLPPEAAEIHGGETDRAQWTATPSAEVDALKDIYKSTNGAGWSKSTNWLNGGDPCSPSKPWYGIKCQGGHVQQLLLQQNQLTGSLPNSIGNLTELTVASLDCFNAIGGTLPATIGNLKKTFVFTMASDKLTGSIPKEVCDMSALSILHLGGNPLTNPIPECLGSMSMSSCGLEDCAFKCPLPSWAASKCDATCT